MASRVPVQLSSLYGTPSPLNRGVSPPISALRAPLPLDSGFPIGQLWVNTNTGSSYILSDVAGGTAQWALLASGTGTLDSLTGDSGGVILPVGGNIDIRGVNTTTVVGSGNTLTVTPTVSGYPITPYVVGPAGKAGYQTIQSAVDAVTLAGGGEIYVQAGTYVEDLIFTSTQVIRLIGEANTTIRGTHFIGNSTNLSVDNFNLVSTGDIFFSNVVIGFVPLSCSNCAIDCNGFLFNMPTWIPGTQITITNCSDFNSTANGIVNAVWAPALFISDCSFTAGGITFPVAGQSVFNNTIFGGPIDFQGARYTCFNSFFEMPVTFENGSVGTFQDCHFLAPGVGPAILNNSGLNTITLYNSIVDSLTSPAIGGTGTLVLSGVTFPNNSTLAGTQTVTSDGGLRASQFLVGTQASPPQMRSGTGDPSGAVSAPQGSLYLRVDGSSSSTRAYINTNGTTAWTSVTTAT